MPIQKKFTKFLMVLSDVITIPFLILSLLTALTMYNAKKNGFVPSLFGKSIVTIVSESMFKPIEGAEKGFTRGDTVVIKKN